jgi:hypothetical protein
MVNGPVVAFSVEWYTFFSVFSPTCQQANISNIYTSEPVTYSKYLTEGGSDIPNLANDILSQMPRGIVSTHKVTGLCVWYTTGCRTRRMFYK